VVILHSLSVGVEQLSARGAGAPSVEELRPRFCTQCGRLARNGGRVRVQGHGFYSRQVCGLSQGWIVIWVRRYVCRDCGHTMSRLPDWLHPWRWYAAVVIIEALYRHLILGETARLISVRFGRTQVPAESVWISSFRSARHIFGKRSSVGWNITIAPAHTPVSVQEHRIRVRRRPSFKPSGITFRKIAELQ